ncbi:hypothetical protein ALC62_00945 [Cyphomyrmex costatus]|uniref:Uncharacterized protein n=1 Tax=Cyphomyrmex costatus TaxID=456900 RepID=A0A195D5D0_9HYME|nr:hypothetical protein ALC62_00945 [Cyphomyrmex costatus]
MVTPETVVAHLCSMIRTRSSHPFVDGVDDRTLSVHYPNDRTDPLAILGYLRNPSSSFFHLTVWLRRRGFLGIAQHAAMNSACIYVYIYCIRLQNDAFANRRMQRENPLGRGTVRRRDDDFSLSREAAHRARLEKRVRAADRRKTGSLSLLKIAFHVVKKFSFPMNPVQPLFTKRLHVVYYANVMHWEWTSQDVNACPSWARDRVSLVTAGTR